MATPMQQLFKTAFRLLRWSLFLFGALGYVLYYNNVLNTTDDVGTKQDGKYPDAENSMSVYTVGHPEGVYKYGGEESAIYKGKNSMGFTPYFIRSATTLYIGDSALSDYLLLGTKKDLKSHVQEMTLEVDCDGKYLMTEESVTALKRHHKNTTFAVSIDEIDLLSCSDAETLTYPEVALCFQPTEILQYLNPGLIDKSNNNDAEAYKYAPTALCSFHAKLGEDSDNQADFLLRATNSKDEFSRILIELLQRNNLPNLKLYKTVDNVKTILDSVIDETNCFVDDCFVENHRTGDNTSSCGEALVNAWEATTDMQMASPFGETGWYTGPGSESQEKYEEHLAKNPIILSSFGSHKATEAQRDACEASLMHYTLVTVFMYGGLGLLSLGLLAILFVHAKALNTGYGLDLWTKALDAPGMSAAKLSYLFNFAGYGVLTLASFFLTAHSFADTNEMYYTQLVFGSEVGVDHIPTVKEDIHGNVDMASGENWPNNPRTNDILLASGVLLVVLELCYMVFKMSMSKDGSGFGDSGSMMSLMRTIL